MTRLEWLFAWHSARYFARYGWPREGHWNDYGLRREIIYAYALLLRRNEHEGIDTTIRLIPYSL